MTIELKIKRPESLKDAEYVVEEVPTYYAAVSWLAWYCEARARMGDMTATEVFDEFKDNVCAYMRDGFDDHGVQ